MIWVYLENVFQQRGGESLASIKDVARQAGVAISTVSKVLNGYEGVSESTKDKVNAAIEALNYTPNAVAAALSSKQFGRVALLLKLEETVGCVDEINLQYLSGAIHRAKELKLDMKASQLASSISVDTPSDTRVLQITVVSDDPYQAKKIADCVAKVSSQKICDIMKIEQVNVIEEGSLSETPAFAVVQKWTIIGALAGIVLSAAVIVIKSMLDDTVKTTEDVEKYFDLSTLAVIPISEEMDDGLPKNKKKSRKNKKNKNKK